MRLALVVAAAIGLAMPAVAAADSGSISRQRITGFLTATSDVHVEWSSCPNGDCSWRAYVFSAFPTNDCLPGSDIALGDIDKLDGPWWASSMHVGPGSEDGVAVANGGRALCLYVIPNNGTPVFLAHAGAVSLVTGLPRMRRILKHALARAYGRVFTQGKRLTIPASLCNHGGGSREDAPPTWRFDCSAKWLYRGVRIGTTVRLYQTGANRFRPDFCFTGSSSGPAYEVFSNSRRTVRLWCSDHAKIVQELGAQHFSS